MKRLLRTAAFAASTLAALATANGATSLNFYFGALRGADGEILPDDTLVVLIANTDTGQGALPGGLVPNPETSGLNQALS